MDLEAHYLQALRNNYQWERAQTLAAKFKFIRAARCIQRKYRAWKAQSARKAAITIQKAFRRHLKEQRYWTAQAQKFRVIYYRIKMKHLLRKRMRLRRSELLYHQHRLSHQPLKIPHRTQLVLARFCRRFNSIKLLRRKAQQKDLLFRIKFKLLASKVQSQLRSQTLLHQQERCDRLLKEQAITNEMAFIENIIAANQQCFELHWQSYESRLAKFMSGRQRYDDWVKHTDEFEDVCWVNIKTMQKTYNDPLQAQIEENTRSLKRQAQLQLNTRLKYLNDQQLQLQDLKTTIIATPRFSPAKFNTALSGLLRLAFTNDQDFTKRFRGYLG